MSGTFTRNPYIDDIVKAELTKVKKRVLEKDRDYVAVYDGEEGAGKSVLAMQHGLFLDPEFTLDNVVFNADDFIKKIKDPKTKKGTCIILDEAFNAANSRSSLTQVNRAMIALATEMRQKNLFVLLVLPTFFDLDRYFAVWRCRALFHVYFTPNEDRHYIIFPKDSKKLLYLSGKKQYNYNYPKSPFPPCHFKNEYVVDETLYREKKAIAFRKRAVSNLAKNWLMQRNAILKYMIRNLAYSSSQINEILKISEVEPISKQSLSILAMDIQKDSSNIHEIEVETEQKAQESIAATERIVKSSNN